MKKWPWIERRFNFDFPPEKFPDLLERLRGTPVRVEALVAGLSRDALTASDGQGWSIQQNVGHLVDCEALWHRRFEQFLAGETELCGVDMGRAARAAPGHHEREFADLLASLRSLREQQVALLEATTPADWARTARHPRLDQQMRLVDLMLFAADHDDYHLARIRQLVRTLGA